jgi:hypothetical protein
MAIGNIVGGIAHGVDRGIDTVSNIQDMWARQDQTKLRDMEMQRLKQPFDHTSLPLYTELDDVGRARVDKAFSSLPKEWQGTQGGATMVLKNLVSDTAMLDSFEKATIRQAQLGVINAQNQFEQARVSGDAMAMREAQANLQAQLAKTQTMAEKIDGLKKSAEIANILQNMNPAQKRDLELIAKTGGIPAVSQALLKMLEQRSKVIPAGGAMMVDGQLVKNPKTFSPNSGVDNVEKTVKRLKDFANRNYDPEQHREEILKVEALISKLRNGEISPDMIKFPTEVNEEGRLVHKSSLQKQKSRFTIEEE